MKRRDVIFTILGVALVTCAAYCFKASQRAKSISCTFHISAIGLGTSLWADENNHGIQPGTLADLIACSNEITTTKVLICPADSLKQPALDFSSIGPQNLSYQLIGKSVSTQDTNNAFLRCEVHGHLGYSFGVVSDGKRKFIPALEAQKTN